MNKGVVGILVIIALLVGAYAGYAYEKNKLTGIMMTMQTSYQQQLDSAKMMANKLQMAAPVVTVTNGHATGQNGMSLYTFDKDTATQRNCTGGCLTTWPPYVVSGTAPATLPDHVGTFKLSDGSMQYTWDGKLLYYYSGDKKAGDTTGDGVGGIWHLAR